LGKGGNHHPNNHNDREKRVSDGITPKVSPPPETERTRKSQKSGTRHNRNILKGLGR